MFRWVKAGTILRALRCSIIVGGSWWVVSCTGTGTEMEMVVNIERRGPEAAKGTSYDWSAQSSPTMFCLGTCRVCRDTLHYYCYSRVTYHARITAFRNTPAHRGDIVIIKRRIMEGDDCSQLELAFSAIIHNVADWRGTAIMFSQGSDNNSITRCRRRCGNGNAVVHWLRWE